MSQQEILIYCSHGQVPVIVAENKLDLFVQTEETAIVRKRQQIVSLMQRFPFVRQCIKCSAKNLLRVDDVFLKSQQAVLYPFVPPLYDLDTGSMTIECKRAFTRIFRIFDRDHDGLLSDTELERFQRDTYHVAIFDRDLTAWKKVVSRHNPSEQNLKDGKFTVSGFLAIFDVFISQNRLDVVWECLRKYNYDDDLNLHVPDSVTNPAAEGIVGGSSSSWKLSGSAKKFLTRLFKQFDSDQDGTLSPDDVVSMFSILSPPCLPPWHPMRAPELFEGCFSGPKESPAPDSSSESEPLEFGVDTSMIEPSAMSHSLLTTSGVSILSASDSLPSVDVGGMHPLSKSLSFLEWMGHWHTISVISPAVTRAELYRLGLVDSKTLSDRRRKPRKKKQRSESVVEDSTEVYRDATLRSREIRVLVLGSRSSGKTALLNALCGTFDASGDGTVKAIDTTSTSRPETSAAFVRMKRNVSTSSGNGNGKPEEEEFVVHFVFTDVPEAAAVKQEEHLRDLSELFGTTPSSRDRLCDLAMLVFDCSDGSSFEAAKELETTLLTKETPRVYVGTKSDLLSDAEKIVMGQAEKHCSELDIEPPIITSALEDGLGAGGDQRASALEHLARCILTDEPGIERLKSRPHEEQKRRDAARRRKMMWLGGIVSVGVVVAVGVGLLWGGPSKKDQKGSAFGWLRTFFATRKTQTS